MSPPNCFSMYCTRVLALEVTALVAAATALVFVGPSLTLLALLTPFVPKVLFALPALAGLPRLPVLLIRMTLLTLLTLLRSGLISLAFLIVIRHVVCILLVE